MHALDSAVLVINMRILRGNLGGRGSSSLHLVHRPPTRNPARYAAVFDVTLFCYESLDGRLVAPWLNTAFTRADGLSDCPTDSPIDKPEDNASDVRKYDRVVDRQAIHRTVHPYKQYANCPTNGPSI